MKPSRMTVYELFERQRRYVVPLFQRPYVWSRDEQIEPLWDDILTKAREYRENRKARPHFLGAIVLNQQRRYGRELDSSAIIDGQQRLTTLQIMLTAFRDVVAGTDDKRLHDELRRLTVNDGRLERPEETFKVWPTNADRHSFRLVMEEPDQIEVRFPAKARSKALRPPLVDTYCFFRDEIREFSATPADEATTESGGNLHDLFDAIKWALQLVVIDLEDDDDPQVIFETLNARGVPLLPSDLIRNFVFLRATRDGREPDDLYDTHWREYDERKTASALEHETRFWKIRERQGRMLRPRLDLFLIHYLTCVGERETSHSHLFDEFRAWWESQPTRDVALELQRMRRFSDAFARFIEPDPSSRMGAFLARLRVLDTSMVYPLLLLVSAERASSLSPEDQAQIATDLESYLIRRAVCNLTTKSYNKLFLSLLRVARSADGPLPQVIRAHLLGLDGDISRWPNDREFERAWLSVAAYQTLGPQRSRVVLAAIEDAMRTSKNERVKIEDALTVEHVLPQGWREHWPLEKPDEPVGENETRAEMRDRLLHTFGNLTLLTQGLNTAVSNGPYEKKRPEIAQQSALRLNVPFQITLSWSEAEIRERGTELLEIARAIWPYPGGA